MLKELPRTMVKLKKVENLLLDGCNQLDFAIETKNNKLLEMLDPENVGIDLQTSSSAHVLDIPRDFESFLIYLPSSLVNLLLKDCKLSDSSFPMDFSCLSSLKILNLDGNPITSMPDCVRSLCKLKILTMRRCNILRTVVYPPHTLRELSMVSLNRLRIILFVQEMSPLDLKVDLHSLAHSSFLIEGMVKIQLMEHVKEEVIRSLGWTNLAFIKNQRLRTSNILGGTTNSQVQMYFEFGIFSTFYCGEEIPNWISERSKGPSISFTIPSSPNNLRGINFCYVQTSQVRHEFIDMPMIRISNITKNRIWIYNHYIEDVNVRESSLTFLSHWLLGKNELEDGDKVTITIIRKNYVGGIIRDLNVRECGVSLLYDDEGKMEEEEDVLGYYKSWNHIIGGDLSGFQSTTGEYILHIMRFWRNREIVSYYHPYVAEEARYIGRVTFRAFSKGKRNERMLKEQMQMFEEAQEQEMQEHIEKIEQEHEQEMQYIKEKWHSRIQNHEQQTERWEQEMQEQFERVKQWYKDEMHYYKKRRHSMIQEQEREIERCEQEMQEQIERVKQEWTAQQPEMQKQTERIEQALLCRE